MRTRTRSAIAGLLAALMLTLGSGAATANRSLSFRGPGERGETVSSSGRLRFTGTEGSAATEITCNVTFAGTVPAVIPKVAGTDIGGKANVTVDRAGCRHGSFIRSVRDFVPLVGPGRAARHTELGGGVLKYEEPTPPRELWRAIYDSFQGTLPGIAGINGHIRGIQVNMVLGEPFGGTIECLYEGDVYGLISISEGITTQMRAVRESTALTRTRGSGLCPARGTVEGTFTMPRDTIALL